MEVPGKKDDEEDNASDQIPTPVCQPCNSEGTRLDAEVYCRTCREYLCQSCYNAHKIPRPLRHHILLGKTQMPLDTETNKPDRPPPCSTPCGEHPDEHIKFLCESHDIVVCGVCSVLNHQKPCNLRYIPDIKQLSSYNTSTEFKSLVDRLETLERNINASIAQVSDNKDMIEEKINAILEDFEALRRTVEEYFDKKEKELKKITAEMKQEDETSLQNLLDDLNALKTEVEEKRTKLARLENETSNLFAASKRIKKQMSEFEKMFTEFQDKNKEPQYKLNTNESIQRLLSSDLFEVERSYKAYPIQQEVSTAQPPYTSLDFRSAMVSQLPDIQVKLDDDDGDPWISGLVCLPPSTLLIVDHNNYKLKAIDTNSNAVMSQLSLDGLPWDITALPGGQEVAVTLPVKNRIDVISKRDKLRLLRSIDVDGRCQGICSTGRHIFVSFCSPSKVQMMDMTGNVLSTIQTNDQGKDLFSWPQYLTVTEAENGPVILVSDRYRKVISKLTMEGKLITTYKHGEWKNLKGVICVGNNQLLVCDYYGDTVDVVTGDHEVMTLLKNEEHGIDDPYSLCYVESERKLYVGCWNSLKVYRLSPK